jgi:hypothetical protein
MNEQELCLLTFSRYYRYIQQNENLIYPDLLSVDNLNQISRIHLTRKVCHKINVSIDREVHFNNNSVCINYFFSGDANDYVDEIIARWKEMIDDVESIW